MNVNRRDFIKGSLVLGGSLIFPFNFAFAAQIKEKQCFPAYGKLENEGKLAQRVEEAYSIFEECQLCPRQCGVNRLNGERGYCKAPSTVMIYSAHPHFGEEISLVGKNGSGTIFFSNCNLRCVFCQNWPISIEGRGRGFSDEHLAQMMLHLQKIGCHNINLVTPTHVMPNIVNAARIAFKDGLRIPLVYNTSGYERVEIVKLLDGIVDIYLPDMKYMNADKAAKFSAGASDYPEVAKAAIIEMHRQVGIHQVNSQGIATRGVMIRHLVMPNRVAGTEAFVRWVAENLPKTTYVNIMHQYHVDYKAFEYPEIWRAITVEEYLEAMQWAQEYGLKNLDPKSLVIRDFFVRHEKNKES
ncbi:MAG: radical SAM protein [Desulfobacterales bacterium]|jgi:putative pyruvate formate lyase activating enzyme